MYIDKLEGRHKSKMAVWRHLAGAVEVGFFEFKLPFDAVGCSPIVNAWTGKGNIS